MQATSGLRATTTFLSNDQLREAEAVFQRIASRRPSLTAYLDYALAHYREPETDILLSKAVFEYLATKQKEVGRTLISKRQYQSINIELTTLQEHFPAALISQCTPALLIPYWERGDASLKTYNNRRGVLSTFFKFAFQKDWVSANPVEKTPYHRIQHRRGSATTITAEQAEKLMAHVETYRGGVLVPYFALCLFAGIRPATSAGEISKLRPEQVRLDTGVIHIEPEVSKVGMKRLVTIQPNLAAWLQAYPLDRFPIIPSNVIRLRRKVFDTFGLTHDVLRHTFISMHVAKFRSMGEAALQAGNSESIIKKHYLDLKSPNEAAQFFGILPKHAKASASAPAKAAHCDTVDVQTAA